MKIEMLFNIYQYPEFGKFAEVVKTVNSHGEAVDAIEKMEVSGKEGYAVSALVPGRGAIAETKNFQEYADAAEQEPGGYYVGF